MASREPAPGVQRTSRRQAEPYVPSLAVALTDYRLARTPYFVLPKLAILAMPEDWQERLERLMIEAEAAGIETPDYHVFRDDGQGKRYTRARCVNERTGYVRLVKGDEDPWANYKYGSVSALCPGYRGDHR